MKKKWEIEMDRLEAARAQERREELAQLKRAIADDEQRHAQIMGLATKLFVLAIALIALGGTIILSFDSVLLRIVGFLVVLPAFYIQIMLGSGRYQRLNDKRITFSGVFRRGRHAAA